MWTGLLVVVFTLLSLAVGQPALSPGGGIRIPSVPSVPLVPRPRAGPTNGNRGSSGRFMTNGNNPPSGQSSACATAGRGAIAQCFQSNGGFQMQQVIGLMSRGAQGAVPSSANRMREAICGQEGVIIACIFEGVNSLETGSQCPSQGDFTRLQQETVNLITGLQVLCGKGPLPAASPCLTDLNVNLKTCFSDVGMDSSMFNPSSAVLYSTGNLTQTVGAIIGKDSKAASKFCSIKERLFACMKNVMDKCEGSTEVVALSGFEPESLRKGIEVLCHDVSVYVDGLKCFQNVPPEVERCYDNMQDKVSELSAQQLQSSMPLSQFYDRFCQVRIQHMECDIQAWRNQCQLHTIGLKNEFECALLPTRCKNDRSLQGRLQQTCAIKRFHRDLRSSASPMTFTKAIMMIVSIRIVFIL